MEVSIEKITADYLALRGESPDLLPVLEEGEDSAVLTLAGALLRRIEGAAAAATAMTPAALLADVAQERTTLWPPDYLKPAGRARYVPFPTFDGKTLTIGKAAYQRLLVQLAKAE